MDAVKASELIELLQEAIYNVGDLDIYGWWGHDAEPTSYDTMEVQEADGKMVIMLE